MADVLAPPCLGRTVNVDASCGCTLSAMTITGLTPTDIANLADSEIDVARLVLEAREAKILGVPERGLEMLLKGKIQNIKPEMVIQKISGQSIIQPFIMRSQPSFINDNYFKIDAGVPTPGAGVGNVPASSWDLTLELGGAWINDGGISKLEQSFVVGHTLIVHTWDNIQSKTALTLQFVITASVNADAGGVFKAKVSVVPNLSAADWAALTLAQQNTYHPTFGVAQTAANNVDDYESDCNQQRSDLNRRIILNWIQTSRNTICTQMSYEEVLDAILSGKVNNYLKGFKYVDLANQEKQKMARYKREWMNSVMYGQIINGNQTEALWRNLPPVLDPLDATCQLGVHANALGFFTLLNNCNRVIDLGGGKLSLDYIINTVLYPLRRNREADGDSIKVLDSMTNRYMSSKIFQAMTAYYQAKYHAEITIYAKIGEKIEFDGMLWFTYNVYDIQDAGVQWAVYVDDYFNDFVDSFNQSIVGWDFKTRANSIWFIDWSDIAIGVMKTNQVVRKYPDMGGIPEIYKCVMRPNVSTYRMNSQTFTPLLDRPNRHLIIHNMTFDCPITSATTCSVPQS